MDMEDFDRPSPSLKPSYDRTAPMLQDTEVLDRAATARRQLLPEESWTGVNPRVPSAATAAKIRRLGDPYVGDVQDDTSESGGDQDL